MVKRKFDDKLSKINVCLEHLNFVKRTCSKCNLECEYNSKNPEIFEGWDLK